MMPPNKHYDFAIALSLEMKNEWNEMTQNTCKYIWKKTTKTKENNIEKHSQFKLTTHIKPQGNGKIS